MHAGNAAIPAHAKRSKGKEEVQPRGKTRDDSPGAQGGGTASGVSSLRVRDERTRR